MVRSTLIPLRYRWSPLQDEALTERVLQVLEPWRGVPWRKNGMSLEGIDCVRFVAKILDTLRGTDSDIIKLPHDAAVHDSRTTFRALRVLWRTLDPLRRLPPRHLDVEPMDLIMTGWQGPGHVVFVGPRPNTLWHSYCDQVRVEGWALPRDLKVFAVLRPQDKDSWI